MKPKIAILMLSWLRKGRLLKTLKSLPLSCSLPLHLILRVQGCEKLSNEDKDEITKAASNFFSSYIYFTPSNIGTAAARLDLNHRAAKLGYKYLMFADDDVDFDEGAIDKQFEILEANSDIGAVALRPSHQVTLRVVENGSISILPLKKSMKEFYQVFLIGSAALLFRSSLYLDHLVAPDPEFFIGWWDWDFALQIQKAGYKIVETPRYTIKNHKGGGLKYVTVRRDKFYYNHSMQTATKKWGWNLKQFWSSIRKGGKPIALPPLN